MPGRKDGKTHLEEEEVEEMKEEQAEKWRSRGEVRVREGEGDDAVEEVRKERKKRQNERKK